MTEFTSDTSSTKIRSITSLINSRSVILKTDSECFTEEFIRDITGHYPNIDLVNGKRIYFQTPESKRTQIQNLRRYWADPKNREAQRNRTIERYKDPISHIKTSLGNLKRYSRPEERFKSSLNALGKPITSETRQRCIESAIGGFWYGNVRYYDGPQYCELWNTNLKERVRAFFDYKCVECGTPQTDRSLHVHHVWYNKKTCCDKSKQSFVPLCHACHSKTSSGRGNRTYWNNHFQEIIDTYYQGKCFFTKDEMKAYLGVIN